MSSVALGAARELRTSGEEVMRVPRLLQIGSCARNSGKTTLACSIIGACGRIHPIVALKIVTITGQRGVCQRGGTGCGVCTSIAGGYELTRETCATGEKDTMRLLASGARRVFFLRAFADSLEEGFRSFLAQVQPDELIVCESNSLRRLVRPGVFLMVDNGAGAMKPTARAVFDQADKVVTAHEGDVVSVRGRTWQLTARPSGRER